MRITEDKSDEAILTEIGDRVASARIELNLTQSELANKALVSKSTIERLESGTVSTQLSSFIRVCRVLNLIDRLELLLPAITISPITLLKLNRDKRKRASRAKSEPHKEWTWGDP
jgi:predicted transcriptional regulator